MPVHGVTVYGNYGRTFQIGAGSGAYLVAPASSMSRRRSTKGSRAA
ncbi:hypothetical protein QP185_21620 [Sphingomonas aerolata]